MTEKVKITQEQADAIDKIKIKSDAVGHHLVSTWYGNLQSLNKLSLDTLIKALYIGYEVEPKFKVGDWVANLDGGTFYPKGNIKAVEVLSVEIGRTGTTCVMHGGDGAWGTPVSLLRHATPEEIAKEKENHLWKSIGREVKEFQGSDIGVLRNGSRVTGDAGLLKSAHYHGDLIGFYPAESFIKFGGDE